MARNGQGCVRVCNSPSRGPDYRTKRNAVLRHPGRVKPAFGAEMAGEGEEFRTASGCGIRRRAAPPFLLSAPVIPVSVQLDRPNPV